MENNVPHREDVREKKSVTSIRTKVQASELEEIILQGLSDTFVVL